MFRRRVLTHCGMESRSEKGGGAFTLGDSRLGSGYMRITTALPEDNARFVAALRALLA